VEKYPLALESSRFDLVLFVRSVPEGLRTVWLYNADLFDAARIERSAARFERLLEHIVADPDTNLDALGRLAQGSPQAPASRLREARRQAVDLS
jgi:non-ribosomal peptide synthetase component F